MEKNLQKRKRVRGKRILRVRKTLRAVPGRPRLTVFKSNKQITAQIIDDIEGKTVVSASSLAKEVRSKKLKAKDAARVVGEMLGKLAKEKKIERVVFDRGRYRFHGIIAELANAARETGLQF